MLVDFSGSPHGGKLKLLPEAYQQTQITPLGLVDHSIVGGGLGAYYYFRDLTGSESTFINNLDGELWQLMPCDRRADAQVDGNAFTLDGRLCGLLSIEHADNGDPDNFAFTPEQIASDIWLHDKLARRFGWPRRRISAPTGDGARGLGFHSMWLDTRYMRADRTTPWTTASGKTCPGRPVRVQQWETVLLPAFIDGTIPEEDWMTTPISDTNLDAIADAVNDKLRETLTYNLSPRTVGRALTALLERSSTEINAVAAVRAAVDAVRADQAVSGDREEKALALLAEIEADLPEPAPEPTA